MLMTIIMGLTILLVLAQMGLYIWLLVIAFKTSIRWGAITLFFWPAFPVFHWSRAKVPVICIVVNACLIFGVMFITGRLSGSGLTGQSEAVRNPAEAQ